MKRTKKRKEKTGPFIVLPVCLGILLLILVAWLGAVLQPRLSEEPSGFRWAVRALKEMSLREKIGQMIICRSVGRIIGQESENFARLKHLITDQNIGGLIVFRGRAHETAVLTNACQQMAEIPLLIVSDLERGLGHRVEDAVDFPPMMGLGATRSEDLAYAMGEITARDGRAVGIHMTFSPVLDVNINPENPIINTRSIGEDPELVSRLSMAFIRGCLKYGLLVAVKHFPGHGDTDKDSHSVLPTLNIGKERMKSVELYPFARAISSGVQAVMTAHLRVPALEAEAGLPVTLSPTVLTELLRNDLGFQGLIISDAMEMGAITTIISPGEAAVKAVQAGVDIILLPLDTGETIDALCRAVRNGAISEDKIERSVMQVLRIKALLKLHKNRYVDTALIGKRLTRKRSHQTADELYARSLTLVKNSHEIFPLRKEIETPAAVSLSSDEGSLYSGLTFISEIKRKRPETFCFYADPSTEMEGILEEIRTRKRTGVIVVALFSRLADRKGHLNIHPRHVKFVKALMETDNHVMAVSFGSPYFLRHFPGVDGYLCAYHHSLKAQISAARSLFGEIRPRGKLPVSILDLYPYGHGLDFE